MECRAQEGRWITSKTKNGNVSHVAAERATERGEGDRRSGGLVRGGGAAL